jgi:heme/copper-type cytochrome/quinol oxidase subunit 2
LEPIPDDVLKLWSGSGNANGVVPAESDAAAEERENVSGIWWWFMLVLTIVAVAESIVATGYLGTQREEA